MPLMHANIRPPRISRAGTLAVALVAIALGPWLMACAQGWAADQRTVITSAVYGVAHDCSKSFLSALKRLKRPSLH